MNVYESIWSFMMVFEWIWKLYDGIWMDMKTFECIWAKKEVYESIW